MASDRCYTWEGEDLILNLKISAGASADHIGDTHRENNRCWLRVRVAAPAVDGKANKRLCKLLAKQFGVSSSRVKITRGEMRPLKQVRIASPEKLPDFVSP